MLESNPSAWRGSAGDSGGGIKAASLPFKMLSLWRTKAINSWGEAPTFI
ncbi:hypothetical protein KKC1_14160 [Calderihabitans maritimus]|uniref:Uncharacterized protein n=1 Tax=Calderihabitans maritimus TaxID=1246530 RepID=A0A1Z5HSK2_9FIRM|nr:hypothetical protein KKC1_14160 [Calderihabitans maritimus]